MTRAFIDYSIVMVASRSVAHYGVSYSMNAINLDL